MREAPRKDSRCWSPLRGLRFADLAGLNSTALEFGCSSLRSYRMGSRLRGRAEFGPFRTCTRRCGSLVLPGVADLGDRLATLHNITDRDPDALPLEMGEHHITLATEVEDKAIALQVCVCRRWYRSAGRAGCRRDR
jgi:hypothetical protein